MIAESCGNRDGSGNPFIASMRPRSDDRGKEDIEVELRRKMPRFNEAAI